MSSCCAKCGSFAINPHHHGRAPDKNLHLCDVCYWRKEAAALEAQLAEARGENARLRAVAEAANKLAGSCMAVRFDGVITDVLASRRALIALRKALEGLSKEAPHA